MPEVLLFIHGNRFLRNKIKLTKNPCSDQRAPDCHLLSQFNYFQILASEGVIIWFNIPFIINLVKIFILKLKIFLKNRLKFI